MATGRRGPDTPSQRVLTPPPQDDVLVRMFDLICYYEAEIQDYQLNVQVIANTYASDTAAKDKEVPLTAPPACTRALC